MFKARAGSRPGEAAEDRALQWLQGKGLTLVQRNYRVARGPHARGGEIDLILREPDGTLVFVEVRSRAGVAHGGAAASVTAAKQRSLRLAAQHFLLRLPVPHRRRAVAVAARGLRRRLNTGEPMRRIAVI
jgi:putative endonuclease